MAAKVIKFYPKGTPRPKPRAKRKVKPEPNPEVAIIVKNLKSLFTQEEINEINRSLENEN